MPESYLTKSNIVTGQKLTLTYNERGQLTRAVLPSGQVVQYAIDGEGKRFAKSVDGVYVAAYIYDIQGRLVAELEPSGAIKSRFLYATQSHSPDYMIQAGVNYYFLKDQLGSIRAVVNSSTDSIVQLLQYDEFGIVLSDSSPGFQPFGFAGGHYDHQTGLVRFGARDYDAESGRWLSKDPILFNGGQANLYSYVENEPVNQVDPKGTGPLFGAKVCAAVGIVATLYGLATALYEDKQIHEAYNRKKNAIDHDSDASECEKMQRMEHLNKQFTQDKLKHAGKSILWDPKISIPSALICAAALLSPTP